MSAPALAVTQPDGTRQYMHPLTGETVPSVTTILRVISKPALDGWAARMVARYANENWDELAETDPLDRLEILKSVPDRDRQTKADRGTLVHELCDNWAKGGYPPKDIDKSVQGYMSQFYSFLGECDPEYVESEQTVWNSQYAYAGTFDAIAVIHGQTTLLDIKTGRGLYPEYGLQLAALAHGECMVDSDGNEWEMPRITRYALLHLRPRSWKLVPVLEEDACYMAFLAARKIWHWLHEIAPDVLGEPDLKEAA